MDRIFDLRIKACGKFGVKIIVDRARLLSNNILSFCRFHASTGSTYRVTPVRANAYRMSTLVDLARTLKEERKKL